MDKMSQSSGSKSKATKTSSPDFAAPWDWSPPNETARYTGQQDSDILGQKRTAKRASLSSRSDKGKEPRRVPEATPQSTLRANDIENDSDSDSDSDSDDEFETRPGGRTRIVNPVDDSELPWKATDALPRRFPHHPRPQDESLASSSSASLSDSAGPRTPNSTDSARKTAFPLMVIDADNRYIAEERQLRVVSHRRITDDRRYYWSLTRKFCDFHGIGCGEWEGGNEEDWNRWEGAISDLSTGTGGAIAEEDEEEVKEEEEKKEAERVVEERAWRRPRMFIETIAAIYPLENPRIRPVVAQSMIRMNRWKAQQAGVNWGLVPHRYWEPQGK